VAVHVAPATRIAPLVQVPALTVQLVPEIDSDPKVID
jgi:hypothetical protein